MKTNYYVGSTETSTAWCPIVSTTEAKPNKFGVSPCETIVNETIHMEVD